MIVSRFSFAFRRTGLLTRLALIPLLLLVCTASAQKPYRGAEYRTINAMTYGRFEVRMRTAQVSGMLGSFFTYFDQANPWNEIWTNIITPQWDKFRTGTISAQQLSDAINKPANDALSKK